MAKNVRSKKTIGSGQVTKSVQLSTQQEVYKIDNFTSTHNQPSSFPRIYRTYNVQQECEKLKFNPVERLVHLFEHADDIEVKAKIASTLLQYIAPRLKAIEISGNLIQTHEQILKLLLNPSHQVHKLSDQDKQTIEISS